MNFINKIQKLFVDITNNGFLLVGISILRSIINRCFNVFVFYRFDIKIDYTSRIIGKKNISIGARFITGKYFWIESVMNYKKEKFTPRIVIGDDVSFGDFCHVGSTNYIRIGNNVLFGSKCYLTDHNHGIYSGSRVCDINVPPKDRRLDRDKKIIIEDNVWIGDNVVILPNVKIGYSSIIGANAVVTKDVAPMTIVGGAPARIIKVWNKKILRWE